RVAVGFALLILVALIAWALFPGRPKYQEQLDSARSYVAAKEYGKAIDLLHQIPSNSSLYQEAQVLLTAARNADKQNNIETLLGQARALHQQNQDAQSLEALAKALELDPSNPTAASMRDEIQKAAYARKTEAEQDLYVEETRAKSRQLFDAG